MKNDPEGSDEVDALPTPDHAHEHYSPQPAPKISKHRTFENESVKIADDVIAERPRGSDPAREAKTILSVAKQSEIAKANASHERRRILVGAIAGVVLAVVVAGTIALIRGGDRAAPASPVAITTADPIATPSTTNDRAAQPTSTAASTHSTPAAGPATAVPLPARPSKAGLPAASARAPEPWIASSGPQPWLE